MTREQAIEHGKSQLEVFGGKHGDFIKLAIKALEQEPRKDEVILTKEEYGELVSSEFDNGYAKGYREALEQEPTTKNDSSELDKNSKKLEKDFGESDCISRAEMLRYQQYLHGKMSNEENHKLWKFIKDLPSVTPQPRKGHWIADVDKWGDVVTTVNGYRCDKCNVFNSDKDNYCPNCGAKMEGGRQWE